MSISDIDGYLANTAFGRIVKWCASAAELAKLGYYKRNPLERRGLSLVRGVYSGAGWGEPVLFSPGELLNIWEQARIMAGHGGAFAEVGTYQGASAEIICEAKEAAPLHLFDTFEGLPDVGVGDPGFKKGMFMASESVLRQRLREYPGITIHGGLFPRTAASVSELEFSFVHLDVDLYSSTKDALCFFYPRMLPGGRILSHDYGRCEGVWRAFDEFVSNKPETLMPMETTQVLLIKQ